VIVSAARLARTNPSKALPAANSETPLCRIDRLVNIRSLRRDIFVFKGDERGGCFIPVSEDFLVRCPTSALAILRQSHAHERLGLDDRENLQD
jgi:hypothetical protein